MIIFRIFIFLDNCQLSRVKAFLFKMFARGDKNGSDLVKHATYWQPSTTLDHV